MGARIEYKNGDIVGVNGFIYISECETFSKDRKAIFKCPRCGSKKSYLIGNIKNKKTKTTSCGCLKKEYLHNKLWKENKHKYKRLYRIFQGMKSRVNGLTINSHLWKDTKFLFDNNFDLFVEWALKNGYDDTKEIHRVDNGNYSPDNCVWLTRAEHAKTHHYMKFKRMYELKDNIINDYNIGMSILAISKKYNIERNALRRYIIIK